MSVTIKDIAKKSGYSITTVSRALNGYDDVNIDTKEKIIATAQELGYYPNRIAQQLVTKKTNTFAVFTLDRETFQNQFITLLISGLMDELARDDYNLLLFPSQKLQSAAEVAGMCRQRGVGGVVIMGLRMSDPVIEDLPNTNFPTVLVDVPIQGRRAGYVSTDNIAGGVQAVAHLAELGHKEIGFINGHGEAWVSRQRLSGYKQGLSNNKLTFKPSLVYEGDFSKESGYQGAQTLIKKNPELSAIFVASDLMAVGALEGLGALGVRVPEDVSIIGFDDQEFVCHTQPALTTVRQDMYGMGREAARLLVQMVEDDSFQPLHTDLKSELVARESTAPPRNR